MTFQENLISHMAAGYPGLICNSNEWFRVEAAAKAAAIKHGRHFKRWSYATGWTDDPRNRGSQEGPEADVRSVLTWEANGGWLGVMHVSQEFFLDPGLRQVIREVLAFAQGQEKTILLVSPGVDLPADLVKEFAWIDFDLPNRDEVRALAEQVCRTNEVAVPTGFVMEKSVDAALGLTTQEAMGAFSLSLATQGGLHPDTVLDQKRAAIRQSGVLEYIPVKDDLSSVGGLGGLKAWLKEYERAFTTEARDFGLPAPRGVLTSGISGTGKSLTAKCVAGQWKIPLVKFDLGRVFSKYVGDSEAKIQQALKTLDAMAPVLCWLDEVEKMSAGAGASGDLDSGVTKRVIATLLTYMQERNDDRGVFFFMTANDVTNLPVELTRAGRIDERFFLDLPDVAEREDIFRVHLTRPSRKVANLCTPENLHELAVLAEDFVGSEIENVIIAGMRKAFARGRQTQVGDVMDAIQETRPIAKTSQDQIRNLRDWADRTNARKANGAAVAVEKPAAGSRKVKVKGA